MYDETDAGMTPDNGPLTGPLGGPRVVGVFRGVERGDTPPDEATVRAWARERQVEQTRLEELRALTTRRIARLKRAMDAFQKRLDVARLLNASLHAPNEADARRHAEGYVAGFMSDNAEVLAYAAEDMALAAALRMADTLDAQGL